MEGILRRERRTTVDITTVKLPCVIRDRLRSVAKSNRVEMRSLTEYLILNGLERIEREGLPLAHAS